MAHVPARVGMSVSLYLNLSLCCLQYWVSQPVVAHATAGVSMSISLYLNLSATHFAMPFPAVHHLLRLLPSAPDAEWTTQLLQPICSQTMF